MKKLLFVLLAATGISATPLAHAAETPLGWYVGGSLGASRTTLYRNPRDGLVEDDKSDLAWSLRGGYRFHKNWAVEGGYTDLGETRYHFTGEPQVGIKLKAWHLTAVGILPFTERLSGFGKLGVAYIRLNDDGVTFNDTVPHAGLGLSYALTHAVAVRTDYDYYGNTQLGQDGISAKTRSQALTVGLDYRF